MTYDQAKQMVLRCVQAFECPVCGLALVIRPVPSTCPVAFDVLTEQPGLPEDAGWCRNKCGTWRFSEVDGEPFWLLAFPADEKKRATLYETGKALAQRSRREIMLR